MYGGVSITIGAETFVVPPLSLGQLRGGVLQKLQEHDKLVAEGKTFEILVTRGEIILVALRRNYPNFPEEKLLEYLDMTNTGALWMAVLGASGFTAGETEAAKTEEVGTLSPSTEV
jgi:hypothetical protein